MNKGEYMSKENMDSVDQNIMLDQDTINKLCELLHLEPNEKPVVLITSTKDSNDEISLRLSSLFGDDTTVVILQESMNAIIQNAATEVKEFYKSPIETLDGTEAKIVDSLGEIIQDAKKAIKESDNSIHVGDRVTDRVEHNKQSPLDKIKNMKLEVDESLLKHDPDDMINATIVNPIKS
jgi:hypothetical protein